MSNRTFWLIAWVICALSLAGFLGTLALQALLPLDRIGPHSRLWPLNPVSLGLLVYPLVGAVIIAHRPRHTVGWLFLLIGFTYQVCGLANAYILFAKLVDPRLPVDLAALWLPTRLWVVTFGVSPLLLLVFPDGRLLTPRWRWVVWLHVASILVLLAATGTIMEAGAYSVQLPTLLDMLGAPQLTVPVQNIAGPALLVALIADVVTVFIRFRRLQGVERLQLKWFSYAALIFLAVQLILDFGFDYLVTLDPTAKIPSDLFLGIPDTLAFAILPLAAAAAIQRYHLYDIDIIIRKTLIYGVLTAALALVYAGCVILLQSFVRAVSGESQSSFAVVLSTLAIASLFTPLRRRIQAWIDRRFYRSRYNAEQVLAAFTATARDEVDLSSLSGRFLGVVDQAIQPEHLSLWMRKK